MSARKRKLYDLKAKAKKGRKANEHALVAEFKRQKRPDADVNMQRKRWLDAQRKEQEDQLESSGQARDALDLLVTAGKAEAMHQKSQKADTTFGWDAYNQSNVYDQYQRRAAEIPYDLEDYEAAKAADPEFYRAADSTGGTRDTPIDEANIRIMMAELKDKDKKSANFSRRRAVNPDAGIDAINKRNAHFNKKLERAYGGVTKEIKANLERGTALPE